MVWFLSSTNGVHTTAPDITRPEHTRALPLRTSNDESGVAGTGVPVGVPRTAEDRGRVAPVFGLARVEDRRARALAAGLAAGRGQDQGRGEQGGQGEEHQLPAVVRRGVGRGEGVGRRRGDVLVGRPGLGVDGADGGLDPEWTRSQSGSTRSRPGPTPSRRVRTPSRRARTRSRRAPTRSRPGPSGSRRAPTRSQRAPTSSRPEPTPSRPAPMRCQSAPAAYRRRVRWRAPGARLR